MKIHDLTTKTTLEVQDTDLLVIEDEEDTKAITVSVLKEVMASYSDGQAKKFINATIDKIILALQNVKYNIGQLHQYIMYTRIDSAIGEILIAMKNPMTNKWLTVEEIDAVSLLATDNGFSYFRAKVMVDDMYRDAVAYEMRRFVEMYGGNINTELDQELYDTDAGLIVARFDGLTQNDIASITYQDVVVTMPLESFEFELTNEDMLEFKFTTDKDLFVNNVPYRGVV